MSTGTPLGGLRALALIFAVVPLLIGALIPVVTDASSGEMSVTVGVVVVAFFALTTLGVQTVAVPRQFAPAPADDTPDPAATGMAAATEGVQQLRAALFLRLALAQGAVLVGMALAVATGSVVPFLVGFVIGWPAMLLAVPTRRYVDRAHQRMESRGARVPLWDVLLTPRQ